MSDSEWFADEAPEPQPERPRPMTPRPRTRGSRVGPTILILVVLFFVLSLAARVLTDLWWYDSVGYRRVFLTEVTTKIGVFLGAGLLTAGAIGLSLWAAYRNRPIRVPTPQDQVLEQYRMALEPLRRLGSWLVPGVLGLLAGSGSIGAWRTWLLWRSGGSFGERDPQFGKDLGFYVFTLPWLDFVVSLLTVVLVLALLAAAFTHYVYGGLQLPGRGPTTRAAFVQLSVTGALLALVRAVAYWLDRYSLLTDGGRIGGQPFTGLTWTGSHAVLPAKAILAVSAVLVAGLFLASILTRSWRLPFIGVALLAVVAVVVGAIYPALMQSLKVRPSESSLEAPFLQNNIDATRAAFGLDRVTAAKYQAKTTIDPGTATARRDADAIPGIRLIDPNVVSKSFAQLQARRQYYSFPDQLDVDRYTIDGKVRDAVVAVRELNLEGVRDRNWINDHTVYTHGYGFVGAYGNQRTGEGDPVFFANGIDDKTEPFTKVEPRIYFGESSPDYSIVGAPAGTSPREVDHPDSESSVQTNNTYAGQGGVAVGSLFRQLVYGIVYREPKFVLADAVNPESRLLDHRSPSERVQRVAPWLTLDGNVYPAIIGNRVKWIVEGFTTSSRYPYSQATDLALAAAETTVDGPALPGFGQVNYVRNSVKATVDAYDGSVDLYAWDPDDPVLKAWTAAFPGTVKAESEISGELMAHLRYPADLLKVQRNLFIRYHVTEPGAFYSGQDLWRIPSDPADPQLDQPVYYQSLAMPDMTAPAFSVTSTFVPAGSAAGGKEILRGFLAVDADAGSTPGKKSENYGDMRLLSVPGDIAVSGPGQVQNRMEASTERSQNPAEQLNLRTYISQAKQQGSKLTYGNLLTLPFGGGFLYVQPLYVQAANEAGSFPQLKTVIAMFGEKVAWGDTLPMALGGLFGGNAAEASPPTTQPQAPATGTPANQLAAALAEIGKAYADGQAALKKGDFAAYGAAQKRLEDAIARANALAPGVLPTSPSPSPSGTPSASPSASASPTG